MHKDFKMKLYLELFTNNPICEQKVFVEKLKRLIKFMNWKNKQIYKKFIIENHGI